MFPKIYHAAKIENRFMKNSPEARNKLSTSSGLLKTNQNVSEENGELTKYDLLS